MRRLLSVVTFVVFVFAIVSCGGGGGTTTSTTPPLTTSGSTNPVPQITDLQDAGVSGSSLILRVIGTGFINSSSVRWNNVQMATTFVSSTALTFMITAADVPTSGIVQMNVVNPPPGGGTSNTVTIQFRTVPPVLTSISPSEAVEGDAGFTLQANGSSFFQNSVVKWNGVALPTTYINGTRLDAQVSPALLAQAGIAQVTVFTDGPANGATSGSMPFTVKTHFATLTGSLSLRANALRFHPASNRLFASAPSSAGVTYGNSIVEIDTSSTPAIASTAFIGSEPGKLALSGDGSTLFVELRGAAAIRKYDTVAHTPGLQFTMGSDPAQEVYYVGDMEVVPGSTSALAVSRRFPNTSPSHAGVAVYDDGVKRPNETPSFFGADRIAFGAAGNTLYGLSRDTAGFYTIQVDANGATTLDVQPNLLQGLDIKFDAGRIYSTSGQVLDPVTKTILGRFNLTGLQIFDVLPDTANNRVYFIGQTSVGKVIVRYNANTFALEDSVGLPVFDGEFAAAAYMGGGQFAIASDHGTIYFVNAAVAPSTSTQPSLTSLSQDWAVQGSTGFTLQVNGNTFALNSVVKWNGSTLATTFVSSTRLDAQVSATELSQAGTALITAFTPGPGNGATSNSLSFTVTQHNATVEGTISLRTNRLQFNGAMNRVYAGVPGSAGAAYGNSIVEIDTSGIPVIASSTFVGSEPGPFALSSDASTLYVGLQGAAAVRRFDTFTHTPGQQFSLGADSFYGPYLAEDIKVIPGSNDSVVISRMNLGVEPRHAGVAVYDNGVKRPTETARHFGANRIEFGAAPDTVFGLSTESAGLYTIQIDANGATTVDVHRSLLSGREIKWDSGRIYSTSGQVIDPLAKNLIATFPVTTTSPIGFFAFDVAPDVANHRVYFVGASTQGKAIVIGDPATFVPIDTVAIPGFAGDITAVAYLGGGRFAIASSLDTIYFVNVTPSQSATPLPSVAQLQPSQVPQGSTSASIMVTGASFLPNSVVKWNGSSLRTTYSSRTLLYADVPASLLAQPGVAQITVFTNGAGGGATSNGLPFSVIAPPTPPAMTSLPLFADSMLYSSAKQTLFVTVPGSAGSTYGDSLVEIDTSSAPAIAHTTFVGNDPGPLAISDDASTLFLGMRRSSAVVKFDTASRLLGAQYPLGSNSFFGPYYAASIAVLPASTTAVAVTRSNAIMGGVAVYDEAGKRTNETPTSVSGALGYCPASPYLFEVGGGISRITIDANGATVFDTTTGLIDQAPFRCYNGRLYGNLGKVVDALTLTTVGTYYPPPSTTLNSPIAVLPDANGRTYIVGNGYYEKVLLTYDRDTFVFLQKTSLVGIPYTAVLKSVENIGGNRLAVSTDVGVFFVTVP